MSVHLFNREIPLYGLLITSGCILANLIGGIRVKKLGLCIYDFIILEAYCLLGAFIGAKFFFLLISADSIIWSNLSDPAYFNEIMRSGFVFYGGMIIGLLFILAAGKFHKINSLLFIRHLIFLIPFAHAFGRIGCLLAGCCHGKEWHGIFAVTYSAGYPAPAGIPLFPIQAVEAGCLLIISGVLLLLELYKKDLLTVPVYFICYGCIRFVLEFFRGDEARGFYGILSSSQWISLLLLLTGILLLIKTRGRSTSLTL